MARNRDNSDFMKRHGNQEFLSQPYEPVLRSIDRPITSVTEHNTSATVTNGTGSKVPVGQRINRLRSRSRASRDASQDRLNQYTLSDLEKKIDKFEKKKAKKPAKGSRQQSRDNSLARSHKSGDLSKKLTRNRSMTQRSAGESKERSIS